MSQPTLWERVRTGGKVGFDKTWKAVDKLGAPVNRLSNKLGSEAFWPTTLDKESDKAARILKTFCKDGFYAEEEFQPQEGPKQKQKVVKEIPTNVIKNAKGLAIFTTMRSGLWISGAGGSGVLVARKEDGTWSPPSGILLHTAGLGFLVGIDIYDCVIVINTDAALEAFTKIRCTLGSEISVAAGPVGAGGILDSELHKRQAAIFTYLKSRGFYAGVQIDGTIIIERTDENERFYGQKLPVKEILAGKVRHPPYEVRRLMETIKAAQGDTDVDESYLPTEAPPGDYEIDDGQVFGVPQKEDPDPYGVLALEKEGMSIKEAGTHKRASWEAFSFNPAPTSPIHSIYEQSSAERRRSLSMRHSRQLSGHEFRSPASVRSSMDQVPPPTPPRPRPNSVTMTDSATQTDDLPESPALSQHMWQSGRSSFYGKDDHEHTPMQDVPENDVLETSPERETAAEGTNRVNGYTTPPRTPPLAHKTADFHDEEHGGDVHMEEPVVHHVQTFQSSPGPQIISKARIVDVPKRIPPKLPPRNPNRSGPIVVDASPIDPTDETASAESQHDSAHEPSSDKNADDVYSTKEKATGTEVEDVDDDEEKRSDPWAQVAESRHQEAGTSSPMPGGFD